MEYIGRLYGKIGGKFVEVSGDFKSEVREAVANYMKSEGCSCCRDTKSHAENKKRLADLLGVEMYSDGSGADFSKYEKQ